MGAAIYQRDSAGSVSDNKRQETPDFCSCPALGLAHQVAIGVRGSGVDALSVCTGKYQCALGTAVFQARRERQEARDQGNWEDADTPVIFTGTCWRRAHTILADAIGTNIAPGRRMDRRPNSRPLSVQNRRVRICADGGLMSGQCIRTFLLAADHQVPQVLVKNSVTHTSRSVTVSSRISSVCFGGNFGYGRRRERK